MAHETLMIIAGALEAAASHIKAEVAASNSYSSDVAVNTTPANTEDTVTATPRKSKKAAEVAAAVMPVVAEPATIPAPEPAAVPPAVADANMVEKTLQRTRDVFTDPEGYEQLRGLLNQFEVRKISELTDAQLVALNAQIDALGK